MTTLSQQFARYRLEVLPQLAPRTQKDYARHLTVLEARFGQLAPDELKPRDIGAFLDRPKGKIQANRQVAVLSAVYPTDPATVTREWLTRGVGQAESAPPIPDVVVDHMIREGLKHG